MGSQPYIVTMADSGARLLNLYEEVKSYAWEFCGFQRRKKGEEMRNLPAELVGGRCRPLHHDKSGVKIRHGAVHTSIHCPHKEQKKKEKRLVRLISCIRQQQIHNHWRFYLFSISKRNIIMSYMQVILSVSQKKIFKSCWNVDGSQWNWRPQEQTWADMDESWLIREKHGGMLTDRWRESWYTDM